MGHSAKPSRRGLGQAALEPAVLRVLTDAGNGGVTKSEIVAAIGSTSAVSVQRALVRLRERDAPIECVGADRRWRLAAPFAMPLEEPQSEDVIAVLLARAILTPFADADLVSRLDRIAEQLDERARERDGGGGLPASACVSAALTLGTPVRPGVLRALLTACRRRVVRILYASPWRDGAQGRWYEIEPWALRVHDGAAYLRAWRRDQAGPRTFRVAQIDALEEVRLGDGERLVPVPATAGVWGDGDPAFGIDRDRAAVAVVRLHGALARWVSRVQWHPTQADRWIEPGELLERRVAYRSCRELARRIASVFDGVRSIEPAALRDEVAAIVSGARAVVLPPPKHRVAPEGVVDALAAVPRAADESS